jgi:hypothetical protein
MIGADCDASAEGKESAACGPTHFVTRTPLVVNRCVRPAGRIGRCVPAVLPVPGGWITQPHQLGGHA